MGELTDAAKAEIGACIQIVRQDRLEAFLRSRFAPDPTKDPKPDPTKDPKTDPTKDPKSDPTKDPKPDPTKDPKSDPTKEPIGEPLYRSRWWGDVYAD